MAFAPAFWQEDNNTWLNTVVGDIIHTNESSSGSGLCRTAGYDPDDDHTVEVPWQEPFLRKPPEAGSQTSLPLQPQEKSRLRSIADLDKSIKRASTPNSQSTWSKRKSAKSSFSDEPRSLYGVASASSAGDDLQSSHHLRSSSGHQLYGGLSRIDSAEPLQPGPKDALFPPHPAVVRNFHTPLTASNLSRVTSEYDGLNNEEPEEKTGPGLIQQPVDTAEERAEENYPSSWKLSLIVIGLCLSVFLISVDRNIITTAIPQITDDFGSYDDIGWYGSAYLMTACAFQPLYGRVYISFNTKSSFLLALFFFEIGSLICALAPNSIPLIAGRSIQGLGSAGVLTGSFLVITQSVSLQMRPVFFAAIGILYGVGASAGPILGGVFTDKASWRWCFWFNLPVGAVTFASMTLFFRPKNDKEPNRPFFLRRLLHLDLVSNVLLLGICIMIFVALEAPDQGYAWSSARVVGLFVATGVGLIVFVVWQWYMGDKALLPGKIVLQRTVVCSCIIALFTYAVMGMHVYFLPIWFQAVEGDSAIHSGISMLPYMLASAVFSLLAGIFVSKNGLFTPPAILGLAIGTVGCGLLSMLHVSTPSSRWIGYQIVVSTGLGMAVQQGFVAVQTVLPLEQVSIGTAAVVASQSFGGAIFISVANTIFQRTLLGHIENSPLLSGLDTTTLTSTGITEFRSMVTSEQLKVLLGFYNISLRNVFITCIPLVGLAFLTSLGLEWKSVKAKQPVVDAEKPQV